MTESNTRILTNLVVKELAQFYLENANLNTGVVGLPWWRSG